MGSLGAQTFNQSEEKELELRIVKLYTTVERFIRIYEGCPDEVKELNKYNCNSIRGHLDRKSFNEARELAKKIFQLEEKK